MSGHEGASVWTKETAAGLARRLRFDVRRSITPNTADLMALAVEQGTDVINYREARERLTTQLAQPHQCPAAHPVFPIELRVTMGAKFRDTALKLFPNLDGFPTTYLPVRAYFCPVCQELYRQREVDEASADVVEEAPHA